MRGDIVWRSKHKNINGNEELIINLYSQGNSLDVIAQKYEVCHDTIYRVLKRNNICVRTYKEAQNTKQCIDRKKQLHVFCEDNVDNLIKLYQEGFSMRELSKMYNVSSDTIRRALVYNNIDIRGHKQSRNLERYNKNRNNTLSYKFDPDQINNIILLYKEGNGVPFISKMYDVDQSVINRILMENSIKKRSFGESLQYKSLAVQKTKKTIKRRYGDWKTVNKIQQKKMIKKYGVSNPMQIAENVRKQQSSAFSSRVIVIENKEFVVQGYEDRGIYKLLDIGYSVDDIIVGEGVPVIDYIFEEKQRKYFPDIFIPRDNYIVEIKSEWTFNRNKAKNLIKRQACLDEGYKFDFMIFNNK